MLKSEILYSLYCTSRNNKAKKIVKKRELIGLLLLKRFIWAQVAVTPLLSKIQVPKNGNPKGLGELR